MGAMASQITSLTIVYSTVYSGTVGHCAGNSPVTGEFHTYMLVTRKMFSFDDVIMQGYLTSTVVHMVLPLC